MKVLILLALAAVTVAHWPYADQDDKFRMSAMTVMSGGVDASAHYTWYFKPLNNQLQPTFQLSFPNVKANNNMNSKGLVYTLVLDHLAEIMHNGGTYNIVPETTINFNTVQWYFQDFFWFYDDESFGEVIEFVLEPYDLMDGEYAQVGLLDNIEATIHVRMYPDSEDDLVDVMVYFVDYQFTGKESLLAVFWKLVSSTGESYERNVPLSLDFSAVSFEVDSDVHLTCYKNKRTDRERREPRDEESRGLTASRGNMLKMRKMSEERKVARGTAVAARDWPAGHTTSQIWITGGFIATVFGTVPNYDNCPVADIASVVTLSIRSTRLN